ncbi:hypothetical protein I204_00610 [Kwoniella mangroviensis CBS 8886]|uniref:uncharacterized protein n=1 Tax=Kwoniella mangroviensis CBS 8507 TaxID=1296122 RepID=UPI00080CD838|nr:uncharacterized protein I203_07142 [Kwoniella mangroviensis CBS 8507]OCF63821.1 hypothetical protein I203_07142 [Kwoniella mangroviensis CBS 8507]OCF78668.1 hypothetical protein I204_00610 [Kwoniella mangroviensis CBS 8886]
MNPNQQYFETKNGYSDRPQIQGGRPLTHQERLYFVNQQLQATYATPHSADSSQQPNLYPLSTLPSDSYIQPLSFPQASTSHSPIVGQLPIVNLPTQTFEAARSNLKRSRTENDILIKERTLKRMNPGKIVHIDAYTRRPLCGWAYEELWSTKEQNYERKLFAYSNYNILVSNVVPSASGWELTCLALAELFSMCGKVVAVFPFENANSENYPEVGRLSQDIDQDPLRGLVTIEFEDELGGLKAINLPKHLRMSGDREIGIHRKKYEWNVGWFRLKEFEGPRLQQDWIEMRTTRGKHVDRFLDYRLYDYNPYAYDPELVPACQPISMPFESMVEEELPKMFSLATWIRRTPANAQNRRSQVQRQWWNPSQHPRDADPLRISASSHRKHTASRLPDPEWSIKDQGYFWTVDDSWRWNPQIPILFEGSLDYSKNKKILGDIRKENNQRVDIRQTLNIQLPTDLNQYTRDTGRRTHEQCELELMHMDIAQALIPAGSSLETGIEEVVGGFGAIRDDEIDEQHEWARYRYVGVRKWHHENPGRAQAPSFPIQSAWKPAEKLKGKGKGKEKASGGVTTFDDWKLDRQSTGKLKGKKEVGEGRMKELYLIESLEEEVTFCEPLPPLRQSEDSSSPSL